MALMNYTYAVGIDEVGRGPLAGPVAVCAIMARATLDISKAFPGVKDSKLMTPKAREKVFERCSTAAVAYAVAYGSVEEIETRGITYAVHQALTAALAELRPRHAYLYLDGLLKAPDEYPQETVIHGDARIPIVSLASVIAKVSRDALMVDLAREYPMYGFEKHKGYGTRAHYAALATYGPSPVHRKTFLSRIGEVV